MLDPIHFSPTFPLIDSTMVSYFRISFKACHKFQVVHWTSCAKKKFLVNEDLRIGNWFAILVLSHELNQQNGLLIANLTRTDKISRKWLAHHQTTIAFEVWLFCFNLTSLLISSNFPLEQFNFWCSLIFWHNSFYLDLLYQQKRDLFLSYMIFRNHCLLFCLFSLWR